MKKLLILLSLIAPGCIPEGDSNYHEWSECYSETLKAQDYVDFPCDLEVDVVICVTGWDTFELNERVRPLLDLPYVLTLECAFR